LYWRYTAYSHIWSFVIIRPKPSFRLTDLVARYGGEEFVVLLDDVLMEGAEKVAKNLCQKIAVTGFTISSAQEKLKQTGQYRSIRV
jgi:two-component system cell cycle response regulator